MIHISKKTLHFNVPDHYFRCDHLYKSYSYIGNFVRNQYKGPSGCNAISTNKKLSIKKSFSESLERRALMLGGKTIDHLGKVKTFDLISQQISALCYQYTTYRVDHPYCSDTTGTAAHPNSQSAIQKALLELIEKNALFLFWFGKRGFAIPEQYYHDNLTYKRIKKENLHVKLFINTDFYPVNVIIAVIFNEHFIFSGGVGSSLHVKKSINIAINEAYLLKWQNILNDFILLDHKKKRNVQRDYHEHCLQYLNSITNDFTFASLEQKNSPDENTLKTIISSLPNWITNLHVILLQNSIRNDIKIVKVFSTDLNNHIPLKSRIDLNQTINKQMLKLTDDALQAIPECIII